MLSRLSPCPRPFEPAFAGRGHGAPAPRHMLAILLLLGLPVAAQSPGMPAQSVQDAGSNMQRDSESLGAYGIDARMEARLRAPDVADSRQRALVEQSVPERSRAVVPAQP